MQPTKDEMERLEKLNVLLKMFDVSAAATFRETGFRRFQLIFTNSRVFHTNTIDQLEEIAQPFLHGAK